MTNTTIACAHCGGSFAFQLACSVAPCPYCGEVNQLTAAARRRVLGYESEARHQIGQEALARRMAAMHTNAAGGNARVVACTSFLGLFVAWWVIAGASGLASRLHPAITGGLVLLSLGTTFGLFGSIAAMVKPPSDAELLAVDMGRCAECAAFIPFRRGDAQARCPYCHAFAIKPSALLAQSLAAARRDTNEQRARQAEAAAENSRTAEDARFLGIRMGVAGWVMMSVLAAFGMVFAVAALLTKTPSSDEYPTWWVWTTLTLGLVTSIMWAVKAVRAAIAANRDFERRYGVRIVSTAHQTAKDARLG